MRLRFTRYLHATGSIFTNPSLHKQDGVDRTLTEVLRCKSDVEVDVPLSVMPKGVEHTEKNIQEIGGSKGASLSDAERR